MTKRKNQSVVRCAFLAIGLILIAGCSSDGDAETGSPDSSEVTVENAEAASDASAESADDDNTGDTSPGDLPIGAVADLAGLSSAEPIDCSFDAFLLPETPTCYEVTVPENWSDPSDDDQVILQAAVFSSGEEKSEDALIYFDGGPGGHTLDALQFNFGPLIEPQLGNRDFIVFDQRGVGVSEPSLACDELTELSYEQLAGEVADEDIRSTTLGALESCSDRLTGSGVDLTAYNSVASANDVEAIRLGLDYEQLNVIGVSYGTRLGQTYMRMYPDSIRSVVLDSVLPTSANLWEDLPKSSVRAYEQMFAGCAESPGCAERYPDFREDFFAMIDGLEANPVEVEAQALLSQESYTALIDGDTALGLVFQALYNKDLFSLVPSLTEEVANGEYETLTSLVSIQLTNSDFVSTGLQFSVECNEELPFESVEAMRANLPDDPDYEIMVRQDEFGTTFFDTCPAWPSGEAPSIENELVESDIPTLLLGGSYDPITPPSGMDLIAEGLTTSYQFTLPHEGHGVVLGSCGQELASSFFTDPSTEPDDSCLAAIEEPYWVANDDDVAVNLVPTVVETPGGSVSVFVPEGWESPLPGTYARLRTALDSTGVTVQPTVGIPEQQFVQILSGQVGAELVEEPIVRTPGKAWSAYSGSAEGQDLNILFTEGQDGIFLMLVADPDESEELYNSVLLPMAETAFVE